MQAGDRGGRPTAAVSVVIVGGGVGGLECVLALQHLAGDRVDAALICPEPTFRYAPTSVAVPFGRGDVRGFPIRSLADSAGARLVAASVERVDVSDHAVVAHGEGRVGYDVLVIASGSRRRAAVEGAVTFRGEDSVEDIRRLLAELDRGEVRRVAFALPRGATWPLPLYELALMTAAHVAERRLRGVEIVVVTPEQEPLGHFGGAVARAVAELLEERHVRIHLNAYPMRVVGGGLMVAPGATIPADRVVCMPEACGLPFPGLPHTPDGFLPIDDDCAVVGAADVYAVGDATTFPIKQGGIAAQQADHVAQLVARRAGAEIPDPGSLRLDLDALLVTGGEPLYLHASRGTSGHRIAEVSAAPFVAPGGKIAARYLGHYLAQAARD